MFELLLDIITASLFIYVYFQRAQETQAPQVEQELEPTATVMRGEWGTVYDSFWYGDDEDGELYVTPSAPEKMLVDENESFPEWYGEPIAASPYFAPCVCCGEIKVDHTVDDWCDDCNTEFGVYEATQEWRDGNLEEAKIGFFNNYSDLSIRELKKQASVFHIKNYGRMTKAQLVDALEQL